MKKMNIFLIFLLFEISQINTLLQNNNLKDGKIDISIVSLELPQESCIPHLSTFLFNIKVEFSKSPFIKNILSINLSSDIISNCHPFEKTNVTDSFFQCRIDTVDYPIQNKSLYLPLDAPKSDYYTFLNWEEKIGEKPDISNRISDKEINCFPKELNAYDLKEIKSEGCSSGKNIVSLRGEWLDENKLIPENFEINFDKIKGKCDIISTVWIQCVMEGEGNITFSNNFYFEYGINIYMIQKNEQLIHINECNRDDNDSDKNSYYSIFPQRIILFLLVLLL